MYTYRAYLLFLNVIHIPFIRFVLDKNSSNLDSSVLELLNTIFVSLRMLYQLDTIRRVLS